jgi:hypothetical protein
MGAFAVTLETLRNWELRDEQACDLLYRGFLGRNPVRPLRPLHEVNRLFFADDERKTRFPDCTARSLSNACTEAVKALRPAQQLRYGQRIGKHFALEAQRSGAVVTRAFGDGAEPLVTD